MAIAYLRRTQTTIRRLEKRERTGVTVYSNPRWRELSAQFLREYPFCVLCLVSGRVNQGAQDFAINRQRNLIVDHIQPHRGDVNLFFDTDNLETLCRFPCHDRDKQRIEKTGQDWMGYLRRTMDDSRSRDHVTKHATWIPSTVLIGLGIARPGWAGQSPGNW